MQNRSRKRISRSNKSMSKSPKKISVKSKTLHFKDFPEFKPNLTPKEIIQKWLYKLENFMRYIMILGETLN